VASSAHLNDAMRRRSYPVQSAPSARVAVSTDSRGYNGPFYDGFYPPVYGMQEHMDRQRMQSHARMLPAYIEHGKCGKSPISRKTLSCPVAPVGHTRGASFVNPQQTSFEPRPLQPMGMPNLTQGTSAWLRSATIHIPEYTPGDEIRRYVKTIPSPQMRGKRQREADGSG